MSLRFSANFFSCDFITKKKIKTIMDKFDFILVKS